MKLRISMIALAVIWVATVFGAAEITLYAAPAARGDGSGSAPEHALDLFAADLPDRLNGRLTEAPVVLRLLPGDYIFKQLKPDGEDRLIRWRELGNERHRLSIIGDPAGGSRFRRYPAAAKKVEKSNLFDWVKLENCRNLTLRGWHFGGDRPAAYVLLILNSRDIAIEQCSWKDMPAVYYAAAGVSRSPEGGMVFENCEFERVGYDAHAHFLYNSHESNGITVRNCRFVDVPGDFVRFRDRCSDITVEDCEFVCTASKYQEGPAFICFPLFNDVDPAGKPQRRYHEYFGNGVTIRNNHFRFPESLGAASRAVRFHHSGYNPPGQRLLWTAAERDELLSLDQADLKERLREWTGLDWAAIRITGNRREHVGNLVIYDNYPQFGLPKETYPPALIPLTALLKAD